MNPQDKGLVPGGQAQPNQQDSAQTKSQQDAAANVVRSQINSIYGKSPANPHVEDQPESAYDRTHTQTDPSTNLDQWKQYHSAWQDYYQKYYAGYYEHHFKRTQNKPGESGHDYFKSHPEPKPESEQLSKDEALFELRQGLLGKVRDSARKVRKSHHFVPIVAAVLVMLAFAFLQYNRVIIANVSAYISPGEISPQNIVIDPSTDVKVSDEPKLIIPKINVDVPVVYGVGNDYDSQMTAMERGVAHFAIPGANSTPGQVGNTVLSGHSSNDLLDRGDYKFIFAQLEKLSKGDSIYAHYKGKRYTYQVTKKEVVKPSQVDKLIYKTKKPVLTLVTCTPLGTAIDRLLVTAEQISPDPSEYRSAPKEESGESAPIPGNSPTFLERIFGS